MRLLNSVEVRNYSGDRRPMTRERELAVLASLPAGRATAWDEETVSVPKNTYVAPYPVIELVVCW
jgi:hypothetical protein